MHLPPISGNGSVARLVVQADVEGSVAAYAAMEIVCVVSTILSMQY